MIGRRGLVLLGAAATASLGAAVWLDPAPSERGRLPSGSLAFPDLAGRLGGAARIEISRGEARTTLQRDGEVWRILELDAYPASTGRVRELLAALTELRLIEERASDPAMQARLGVDAPETPGSTAVSLAVRDAAGAPLAALVVGRRRVRAQGSAPETVYVRRAGEARAWLAEGRLPADSDPRLWLDRELAALAPARLRRVEVARREAPPLVLARAPEPDAPLLLVTPAEAPPLDPIARDEVARAFDLVTFQDVRRGPLPGEPIGSARFLYTDDVTVTVEGSREGERFWARLAAMGGEEAQVLDARWRGYVFDLGAFKEKAMLPLLADLVAP